jgi:hypothetical protein
MQDQGDSLEARSPSAAPLGSSDATQLATPVSKPARAPGRSTGPVFVFTMHRSGSTLLGRLLNSHPDLVVWGEHSGIINKLAELDFAIKNNLDMQPKMEKDWFKKFTSDADFRSSVFDPWTAPPQQAISRTHARKMIFDLFGANLAPGQRWGFKEIRYHRPYVAQYLANLFPQAKFVLLKRDTVDATVSNILSEWAQSEVKEEMTETLALDVIRDVVYALLAFATGFDEIARLLPARSFSLNYQSLQNKDVAVLNAMFQFLGLDEAEGFDARIAKVLATKFNQTHKRPKRNVILTKDFIRENAAILLPELQAEIKASGVDRARLTAVTGPGKYSFIVGTRRSSYLRL